jgi:hypothetical protein
MTANAALPILSMSWVLKLFCSEYSGSGAIAQNGDNFPRSRRAIAHFAASAPTSLIVAALASLRWLLLSFPPNFVAQNSQYGGASPVSRRTPRRQFRQPRHIALQFFLIPFSESKTECLPASCLTFHFLLSTFNYRVISTTTPSSAQS